MEQVRLGWGGFIVETGVSLSLFLTISFVYFRLSATAGVDFEALREKYTKLKAEAPPVPVLSEEAAAVYERLDAITTCSICVGSGIEKYMYNNQQREQNCTGCDGEGLIHRPVPAKPAEMPGTSCLPDETGELRAQMAAETTDTSALTYATSAGIKLVIEENEESDDEDEEVEVPMPL